MRSLKSTAATATTTATLRGKRKLAQTKEYPESPPATPPPAKPADFKTRGKKQAVDLNSPPAKRRRSSDRIANKLGQKRQSMENDDGFVFTRAPKQRKQRKSSARAENAAEQRAPPPIVNKPVVMDFNTDVSSLVLYRNRFDDRLLPRQVIHSNHLGK
jgi:hypothetical protein